MGVAKVANNYNNLVKGSSTRQKLQNSKGYTESPEFRRHWGLEEVCRYKFEVIRTLVRSITTFFASLARAGNNSYRLYMYVTMNLFLINRGVLII